MKIKVELDIQDVLENLFEDYNPENGGFPELDIKDEIKSAIVFETRKAVMEILPEPSKEQLRIAVKEKVMEKIEKRSNELVKEFLEDEEALQSDLNPERRQSFAQWMEHKFKDPIKVPEFMDAMKKQADAFGDELKARYDLMFASQLVMKFQEQGLLKEGVAESLNPINPNNKKLEE